MLHSFYVYYKIKAADEFAAREAIKRLFSDVKTQTGIAGRLLHRADEPETWMEIYEGITERTGFHDLLERACEQSGLLRLLEPAHRHIEHFQESSVF